MTVRLILASLLIAAPLAAGTALAGSDKPTPAAVNTQQSTPVPAVTPNSSPATIDAESDYTSGGCPFGHKKSKTAATS